MGLSLLLMGMFLLYSNSDLKRHFFLANLSKRAVERETLKQSADSKPVIRFKTLIFSKLLFIKNCRCKISPKPQPTYNLALFFPLKQNIILK